MRCVMFKMHAFRRLLTCSSAMDNDREKAFQIWANMNGMEPQYTTDGFLTTLLFIVDDAKFRSSLTNLVLDGSLLEEDFEIC